MAAKAGRPRKHDNPKQWDDHDEAILIDILKSELPADSQAQREVGTERQEHRQDDRPHPQLLPDDWAERLPRGKSGNIILAREYVPDDEILVDEREIVDRVGMSAMLDKLPTSDDESPRSGSLADQEWWGKLSQRYADERDPSTIFRLGEERVLVECPTCGEQHLMEPTTLFARRGACLCPSCDAERRAKWKMYRCGPSRGEVLIKEWGEEQELVVEQEVAFEGCVSQNGFPLRFDAAYYAKTGNALLEVCLVEYDGQQHFQPIRRFGGHATFKKQVQRDMTKAKFCLDKGHRLVRIPYLAKTKEDVGAWIAAAVDKLGLFDDPAA